MHAFVILGELAQRGSLCVTGGRLPLHVSALLGRMACRSAQMRTIGTGWRRGVVVSGVRL